MGAEAVALLLVLAALASARNIAPDQAPARAPAPQGPRTPYPRQPKRPRKPIKAPQVVDPEGLIILATRGGFSGADVDVAAAIAQAESGARADLVRRIRRGEYAYGLWQIRAAMSGDAREILLNPELNAGIAHKQWQEHGFGYWPSYRDGRYLAFMPAKR